MCTPTAALLYMQSCMPLLPSMLNDYMYDACLPDEHACALVECFGA